MGGRILGNFQLLIDWTTVKDLQMTSNEEQSRFFVHVEDPSSPVEWVIFSVQRWLTTALAGNTLVTRALLISQATVTPPAAHHKWS